MANGRKVVIDQALCRKVELLVKGGAKHSEVGSICGISSATVSRIRTAGFNAEKFQRNNDIRREAEQKKRMDALDNAIEEVRSDKNASPESLLMYVPADKVVGQIKGQMQMDLKKPAEEEKSEPIDLEKWKRFYAAQIQKLVNAITALASALQTGGEADGHDA